MLEKKLDQYIGFSEKQLKKQKKILQKLYERLQSVKKDFKTKGGMESSEEEGEEGAADKKMAASIPRKAKPVVDLLSELLSNDELSSQESGQETDSDSD